MRSCLKRSVAVILAVVCLLGCLPAMSVAALDTGNVINSNYRAQQREMAAAYLLRDVKDNPNLSEADKALIIHDRLVAWVQYGSMAGMEYSMDGALINRVAVCAGYAAAYRYLMNLAGVYCYTVTSHKLNHAWNVVRIDGEYYHVDTTWDDPLNDNLGRVYHMNFLVSTARLKAAKTDCYGASHSGHNADDFFSGADPCTSTKYDNYYWQNSFAEFQLVNDKKYYIDHAQQKIRCADDGTVVHSVYASWRHGTRSYSRLGSDGNSLFYSMPDGVYEYGLSNASATPFYLPSTVNFTAGVMAYEFFMDSGVATIVVKDSRKTATASGYAYYVPNLPSSGLHRQGSTWVYLANVNGQIGVYTEKTGLFNHHGLLCYLQKGAVDYTYTGFATYAGVTYYVENGLVDQSRSAIITHNDVKYTITNGAVDVNATGLYAYGAQKLLFENGKQSEYTGLYKFDGTWYYLEKGRVATEYTGLAKRGSTYYAVIDGKVSFTYTGLSKYGKSWYLVKKGKLNSAYTGLYKWEGNWYYLKEGRYDTGFTGLWKHNGTWYYVQKGRLKFDYTGLYKWNGKWYAVSRSKVKFGYTGLIKYGKTWYLMQKGKLNSRYTGIYEYANTWYYLKKGKVDTAYKGLYKWDGSLWYVKGGKIDTNFNGLVKYGSVHYVIKNGLHDYFYNGVYTNKGVKYVAVNGCITLKRTGLIRAGEDHYLVKNNRLRDYTGLYKWKGTWYYLQKGRVVRERNCIATRNGVRYYVQKGKIDFTYTGYIGGWQNGWYVTLYVKKGVVQD